MIRLAVTLAALGGLVALLCAANLRQGPARMRLDWTLAKPTPPTVLVEPPGRAPIARVVAAQGLVEPIRERKLYAKVPGKVAAVLVVDAQRVAAGAVLVRLDDAELNARLETAKNKVSAARTALTRASTTVKDAEHAAEQHESFLKRGYQPPADLLGAPAKLAASRQVADARKAELAGAESLVNALEQERPKLELKAPLAGVVEGINVAVDDELVPPLPSGLPSVPLMIILDPDQLRLRVLIDEADIPLVRAGQPARVYLASAPRSPLSATVESVAARGQPSGQVVGFAALLRVDDPARALRPGMRANIEVEVARKSAALGVPVQAVLERKALADGAKLPRREKIVYVVEAGHARARAVEVGLTDERRVEILNGLKPDDRVVVGPSRALESLADGALVTLEAATVQASPR